MGKINSIIIDSTSESNTGIFDWVVVEYILYSRLNPKLMTKM